MGYQTCFIFSVHDYGPNPPSNKSIAEYIKNEYESSGEERFYPLMSQSEAGKGLDDYLEDELSKDMVIEPFDMFKWYDDDDDMLKLSQAFPGVIFKLHGQGEEFEDIWDSYYKDGKMCTYKAKISIPPLNPDDLKQPGYMDNDTE